MEPIREIGQLIEDLGVAQGRVDVAAIAVNAATERLSKQQSIAQDTKTRLDMAIVKRVCQIRRAQIDAIRAVKIMAMQGYQEDNDDGN